MRVVISVPNTDCAVNKPDQEVLELKDENPGLRRIQNIQGEYWEPLLDIHIDGYSIVPMVRTPNMARFGAGDSFETTYATRILL